MDKSKKKEIMERAEEIIERAYELGERYEKECTGCAQTTIAGIFDAIGIKNDDVFKSASGLADGVGLSGDGTCGALVGGAMVIGYVFGRERKDFKDMFKPMKSYLLSKELYDKFLKRYGSCRCHDVQESLMGRTFNLLSKKGFEKAVEFGMVKYCSRVVGTSAKMATEIILDVWKLE
jgi:C_GCAxxG_C_C family probable redox protein